MCAHCRRGQALSTQAFVPLQPAGWALLTDVFRPLCSGGPEGEGEGGGEELAFPGRERDVHFQIFPAGSTSPHLSLSPGCPQLTRCAPPPTPLLGFLVAPFTCLDGDGPRPPYHLAPCIDPFHTWEKGELTVAVLLDFHQNRWCRFPGSPPVCAARSVFLFPANTRGCQPFKRSSV